MSNEIEIVIKGKDVGASKVLVDMKDKVDDLNKAGGMLSNGLDSLRGVMMNGLKVAAVGATAAISGLVAGIGTSVNAAMNMEQQLADISASMGTTSEETTQLKDLITDLGLDPKLKVSATEAADAIQTLGTAGLSVDEILDGAAKSTVLLANATGADFADAAAIASDAMALWKVKAKDLNAVVNGVTATTIASKFDINDYRLALAQAGGVAATVGVEFDDFNATIAAISPSFGSGSDAGTSFKTMLQRLVPQSNEAADAMRSIGLFTGMTKKEFDDAQAKIFKYQNELAALDPASKNYEDRAAKLRDKIQILQSSLVEGSNAFYDTNGNMKSMADIAGILQTATAGLSEEQKNQTLSTIFGSDALRAAAAMADTGKDKFEQLKATMAKTDAEEQATTRMNTFKGALEILSGVFETLQIKIGEKFLPVLTAMANKFGEFLTQHSDKIIAWTDTLATNLEALTNWLMAVVEDGDVMNDWLTHMHPNLASVVLQVADFVKWVKEIVIPMGQWVEETIGLKGILMIVAGLFAASFIPVIISVVSTVATVVSGISAFIGILGASVPALAGVVAAAAPVVAIIASVAAAAYLLYLAWTNNFLGIQDKTREAFEYIKGIFTNFPATIEGVKQTLYDWGSSAMGKLREGLVSAQNFVRNGLDVVMDFLQQGRDQRLGPFAQSLYDGGSMALTKLGQGFEATKDFAVGQFNQVMTDVQNQGLGFATGALLGRMYESGRSFLLKIGEGITSTSPGLRANVDAAFTGLRDGFNYWKDNLAPHFFASAKDLFSKIGAGANDIDLGRAIEGAFISLRDGFNYWKDNLAPHFFASAKDLFSGIGAGANDIDLGRAIEGAFLSLRDRFNYWKDNLAPHFFASAVDMGNRLIDGLSSGISNGIGRVISSIQGVTDALPQWVKDRLGIASPSKVFMNLGQWIPAGLSEGIARMANLPVEAMANINDSMQAAVSNVQLSPSATGNTSTDNSRNTNHTWNVTVPASGGSQPTGQMQSLFNTLTSVYAS